MSPAAWEIVRYVVVALIAAAASYGSVRLSSKLAKRGQDIDKSQKSYDQIQEDKDTLRAQVTDLMKRVDQLERERTHVQNEANRVIQEVRRIYNSQEEEITALRAGINSGAVPPLPVRADRPVFPTPQFNLPVTT